MKGKQSFEESVTCLLFSLVEGNYFQEIAKTAPHSVTLFCKSNKEDAIRLVRVSF